ncbi:hypothetical protein H4582DRAFT_2056243 [Lactarius indigo]|nr:hypothetical protein H4582DRAFT_2056243 [Lactarius indigo]
MTITKIAKRGNGTTLAPNSREKTRCIPQGLEYGPKKSKSRVIQAEPFLGQIESARRVPPRHHNGSSSGLCMKEMGDNPGTSTSSLLFCSDPDLGTSGGTLENSAFVQRTPALLVPTKLEIDSEVPWDCSSVQQFTYDGGGGVPLKLGDHTSWTSIQDSEQIWAGSCEVGQLTPGGFHDSKTHGEYEKPEGGS